MRVFQHNTFTLTIHSLCWAKIRSNYFKPYYYSVTMFNLHYSQLTLLINFTLELSYNILHCKQYIAKFIIKYCNLVSKNTILDNSKWVELDKYHITQNAQKTMQEYLRHWINFSFRSKQYFRETISRRILMQSLPFIFQFISIPSVLYFSVIQVFMMLFFPGSRHTSCKRKIKWDKTMKLLCLIICYIEVRNQYGLMLPNFPKYLLLNMNFIISYSIL